MVLVTRSATARAVIYFCAALLLASTAARAAQDDAEPRGDYRIGAGDVLNIVVWGNEKLSMSLPVRPDGMISMPLLNDVRAADRSPMELREAIAQRLSEFVSAPQVAVIVTTVGSFKVSVLGKVRSPGRYDLNGPTTVLDVLAMVGGFEEFTNPDDTYILRPLEGTYHRIPFKYSMAITPSGKSINIQLMPGDFIIVP